MEFLLKRVNKCCCCLGINLRIGTLIILWLGIIFPSITLLTSLLSGFVGNAPFGYGNDALATVCFTIWVWFFLIQMFLFQFLPHALALYGVYKNKPNYLEPYIFLCMVGILFCVVFLIIVALSIVVVGVNYDRLERQLREMMDKETYREGIVAMIQVALFVSLITAAFGAALSYYFTSVVHSQYQKMKEEINKYFGSNVQYDAYNPEIRNSKLQLNA